MLNRELLVENQQGTREDLNNNFKEFPGTLEKFRPVGPFSNFSQIFEVTFKFLKVLRTFLPIHFHGQSERNFRSFRPVCSEFRKYLSASFYTFLHFCDFLARFSASFSNFVIFSTNFRNFINCTLKDKTEGKLIRKAKIQIRKCFRSFRKIFEFSKIFFGKFFNFFG